MKTKRKVLAKRLLAISLAILFALSFIACGNGDSNEEDTQKDELVIGISGAISSLDVNQEAGILNYYIAAIVSEGLVGLGNDGKVVPALAESWDSEDAKVWTFKLRNDAKFSDGSPVTADDIVWSIERAMDEQRSPGVAIYFPSYVESVSKVSEEEIEIVLEESHASFIWAVSNAGGLFVTQKDWGEAAGTIGSPTDLILGSGPYKATEFDPGTGVSFEATDTWWGGEATIPKIRFEFITDDSTRLLAFTNGDIDFALNIPVDQSQQWEDVDGASVEYIADRSYYGLTFDPTVEPFDDVHVRMAVSYAIDAESIINGSILNGHGQVATAITPPEQFTAAISLDEANKRLAEITHQSFDMASAEKELLKSKVADGFETTIFYPDSYQNTGKASLAIADNLKSIGVTLNVKEIPIDQWLTEVGNGEQGVAWMIYFPTTAEPAEIASWLLDASGPGYNPANWTNEEVADLIAEAMSATSLEAEVDPVIEANDLAQQEAIYAPVWWGKSAVAYSDAVSLRDYNSFSLISQNWPGLFSLK